MEIQHYSAISSDDDFCLSVLFNSSENPENNQTVMSDENFAEELQLQEVIASSFITLQKTGTGSSPSGKVSVEIGESSETGAKRVGCSSSQSLCEICAERKGSDDMFPLHCSHNLCTECISKHVSIVIKKQRAVLNAEEKAHISCPGIDCTSILESDMIRANLPGDVITMWDDVLCESTISPSMKFYCPYKNCSELLVNDGDQDHQVIREAECPYCNRLFCAKCKVPWHSGVDCDEFSGLKENEKEREDLMLIELAQKKKWQRCPNCKFYVEKNEGCLHMTCRCQYQFCYSCGESWTGAHDSCH